MIVHTDDAYTYSQGTACTTAYAVPSSCEAAITRTDKSEGSVVWVLASFDSTASPAVTVVYFGIDYDDENLDPGSAYRFCGPAGTLEVPDGDWPYTGRGNSVAFGEAVTGQLLFPFYVFRIDGGVEGSFFSTAVNPSAGYAAFVDDSDPPELDEVTRFGTVRWFAAGESDCPAGSVDDEGDGGVIDGDDDGGAGDNTGDEDSVDGDGRSQWLADCILVQLRDDLPMPARGPVDSFDIPSLDALGRQLGMVSVRRVITLDDESSARYPAVARIVQVQFGSATDEAAAARQYSHLPEVLWAQPNYVYTVEPLDPQVNDPEFGRQWPLVWTGDATSCVNPSQEDTCCGGCDIGLDEAWQFSRGDSSVIVAFLDSGADMQHPDLFDVYARNPDPREDTNQNGTVELCPADSTGDIDRDDDDDSGVDDDILLGWFKLITGGRSWQHPRTKHGTAVAGILAAITNNSRGVASAAGGDGPENPGARLIQFSVAGNGASSDLLSTIPYAHKYGARIYSSSTRFIGDLEQDSALVVTVRVFSDSMLFVQAAGNAGTTPMTSSFAKLPGVMAVGGYDCSGGRWMIPDTFQVGGDTPFRGSDYGEQLSLMGPSGDERERWEGAAYEHMATTSANWTTHLPLYQAPYVCSPDWPDSVDCFGGTSAAAPTVASVAALVFSYSDERELDLTPPQVRKVLERTAEDIQCDPDDIALPGCDCADPADTCIVHLLGWDSHTGYGRIDAGRALTLPVAALGPLEPYPDLVIWLGRVHFSWETIDLDPSNGGTPDHLELHYWIPENQEGWHLISDSLSWSGPSFYDWTAPDSFAVGDNRYFRLSVVDAQGQVLNRDYRRFSVGETTDAPAGSESPPAISALRVSPNPTSSGARVRYVLRTPGDVSVRVFDVAGRHVRTLAEGRQEAGPRVLTWDGRDESGRRAAGGVYFIRLKLGSGTSTVRLVSVR